MVPVSSPENTLFGLYFEKMLPVSVNKSSIRKPVDKELAGKC
jgi:hypothetical protein